MKIIKTKKGLTNINGAVVTLGNFDGVHLGHQKILKTVAAKAGKLGAPSVVYTFEPHPMKVVQPKKRLELIIPGAQEKARLIKEFDIDYLVLARFTKGFATKHPADFVRDVLVRGLGAREVYVGSDYSFGRGRRGTVEYLKKLGIEAGFKVVVVGAAMSGGEVISSSRIRGLIKDGDVSGAQKLLGRAFEVTGRVVRGRDIGSSMGFPTANLKTASELIPGDGVYAATVTIGKGGRKLHRAVANVGNAPTFKRNKTIVEVHLLDFKGSIYGKYIQVQILKKLRNEIRFASADQLKARITKDVALARKVLRDVQGPKGRSRS